SSGRRHTSFSRDWSSDVCSSDLLACEKRGKRPSSPPGAPHDRTSAGAPRRHSHPRPEVAGAAGPPYRRGRAGRGLGAARVHRAQDRKSTRLNSSHVKISYAVFCLKKKKTNKDSTDYTI